MSIQVGGHSFARWRETFVAALAYTVAYGLAGYLAWWPLMICSSMVAEWPEKYAKFGDWLANAGAEAMRAIVASLIWAPVAGMLSVPTVALLLVTACLLAWVTMAFRNSNRAWPYAAAGLLVGIAVVLVLVGLFPGILSISDDSAYSTWFIGSAIVVYLAVTVLSSLRIRRAICGGDRQMAV